MDSRRAQLATQRALTALQGLNAETAAKHGDAHQDLAPSYDIPPRRWRVTISTRPGSAIRGAPSRGPPATSSKTQSRGFAAWHADCAGNPEAAGSSTAHGNSLGVSSIPLTIYQDMSSQHPDYPVRAERSPDPELLLKDPEAVAARRCHARATR